MLNIYPVILSFVEEVAPIIGRISRSDPDLARQLRRSSAAVVLNVADGMYARGRSRTPNGLRVRRVQFRQGLSKRRSALLPLFVVTKIPLLGDSARR